MTGPGPIGGDVTGSGPIGGGIAGPAPTAGGARRAATTVEATALTPRHEALAQLLWEAEVSGEPIEPISATFPELTVADAYRIQGVGRRLRTADGEEQVGWKVGLTSVAMQEMMGVDQPDSGYLTESMVVSSGAQLPGDRFIQPRVEAEIAFLLRAPLEGPAVTREQVLEATDAFAPALEVIDSRIIDWRIAIVDTVADNASSGICVIGDWEPIDAIHPERIGVTLAVGREVERGRGSAVLGHPAEPVAWLARTLAAQGQRLQAGEVVMPGSVARAVPIAVGQTAYATFDALGEVRLTLV